MFNLRFLHKYFVDNILDKQHLICLHMIKGWLVGWIVIAY